jgi:AcrR family transcriptional regulator
MFQNRQCRDMNIELHDFSARERLIRTVLDLWATQGHAVISARLLASSTGLPTSSIYHHFGSMEHLFQTAQDHAQEAARAWCADQLGDLAPWPERGGPDALAAVLAALIDEWATNARTLAFAWAQCHLLALRDPAYVSVLDGWRDLWAGFWREVCARAGLSAFARPTAHFFEGAVHLHLIRWRRTIDRAALDEICRGWSQWLGGSLANEGAWRGLARQIAQEEAEPPSRSRSNVADAIAQAAARVVEDGGVAALTHRAVAARAGVTLGVVSYNVRTSAELAELAFETIYRNVVAPAHDSPRSLPSREDVLESLRDFPSQPRGLIAIEELILAVARDPALAAFAPHLRYSRGRTSGLQLAALLGPDAKLSALDKAIYSSLVSGQRRALIGRGEPETLASIGETDRLIDGLRTK